MNQQDSFISDHSHGVGAPHPPQLPAPLGNVMHAQAVTATAVHHGFKKPILTPIIIVLNILIYIAMGIAGVGWMDADAKKAVSWGADYWSLTTTGQWWRLLTSAFVHFGLLHVMFNMYALLQAGTLTERLFGRRNYALIYLYGALFSGLTSTWWDRGSVSAGASGAIFAVFGAMLIFMVIYRHAFPPAVIKPLLTSTVLFIGYSLFSGLTSQGVSNAAHIGGLFSGLFMGAVLASPVDTVRRQRQFWPRIIAGSLLAVLTIGGGVYAIPKDYDRYFQLGYECDLGKDRRQDFSLAMKYYLIAAEHGNSVAAHNIAVLYRNGSGVGKDPTQSLNWFHKAADLGDLDAMDVVGLNSEDATPPDYRQAMDWFLKSAAGGNGDAMFNIGVLYNNAWGVPQDYKQAMDWYLKAADKGVVPAMYNAAYQYSKGLGVPQNADLAINWYQKAAAQGYADAMLNLGVMYNNGAGVAQDYQQAMQWYQKAVVADKANGVAMRNIAVLYENGWGTPADPVQAGIWYRKAAAAGDAESIKWVAAHP